MKKILAKNEEIKALNQEEKDNLIKNIIEDWSNKKAFRIVAIAYKDIESNQMNFTEY